MSTDVTEETKRSAESSESGSGKNKSKTKSAQGKGKVKGKAMSGKKGKGKPKDKPAAAAAVPTAKKVAPVKVNKTQAVLQFMKSHPSAGPKEVSETLGKEGIDVSPAYVSGIKAKAKVGKGKATGKSKSTAVSASVSLEALVAAQKLAQKLGSITAATQALAALSQLTGE